MTHPPPGWQQAEGHARSDFHLSYQELEGADPEERENGTERYLIRRTPPRKQRNGDKHNAKTSRDVNPDGQGESQEKWQ